jgi:hypothetical protein
MDITVEYLVGGVLIAFCVGMIIGRMLHFKDKSLDVHKVSAEYKARKAIAEFYMRNHDELVKTSEQHREWLVAQNMHVIYQDLLIDYPKRKKRDRRLFGLLAK